MASLMSQNVCAYRRGLFAVTIAVLPLLGCQKSLPTAPTELMTGVTIYEHANYLGQSAHVTQNVGHLKDFKGPCIDYEYSSVPGSSTATETWDDCISSIRVAPGWRATIYRDGGFNGDRLEVTSDTPNLQLVMGRCDKGGFNDCITSIRVSGP